MRNREATEAKKKQILSTPEKKKKKQTRDRVQRWVGGGEKGRGGRGRKGCFNLFSNQRVLLNIDLKGGLKEGFNVNSTLHTSLLLLHNAHVE